MLPSLVIKFFHFQYATREMCKGALKNYSMLKLRFFYHTHIFAMYCKNVSHQYYATNQDAKEHFYRRIAPNRRRSMFIFFLFATASFITQPFFL